MPLFLRNQDQEKAITAKDAVDALEKGIRQFAKGNAIRRPPASRESTTRARNSRLTWWQMPVFGGTTWRLSNALWPHRRKA